MVTLELEALNFELLLYSSFQIYYKEVFHSLKVVMFFIFCVLSWYRKTSRVGWCADIKYEEVASQLQNKHITPWRQIFQTGIERNNFTQDWTRQTAPRSPVHSHPHWFPSFFSSSLLFSIQKQFFVVKGKNPNLLPPIF